MTARENSQKDRLIVSLEGDFDETTCLSIEKKLADALLKTASGLHIDMRKVKYISSTGIRVLISTYKKAVKTGKKVTLGDMPQKVHDILEVVGILPLFS